MLKLDKYYFNNEIIIHKDEWSSIKNDYDKAEIKNALHKLFDDFNPPFPYPKITEEQGMDDFKKLQELDTSAIIKKGQWNPKFNYKYAISPLYFTRNLTGRKSSAFFMNNIRYAVGCYNKSSLVNSWNEFKCRDKSFDAIFSLGLKELKWIAISGIYANEALSSIAI